MSKTRQGAGSNTMSAAVQRGTMTARHAAASLSQIAPFIPLATRYAAKKIAAADVDDVIQDSLLRVMNSGGGDVHHPKSYFFTVLRAVIVDRLRQETVRRRKDHCELTDSHHPIDPICPCRALEGKQSLQRVMARLDAMPARARDMVLAVRLEGLTFKDVAERHGVSLSTVEKQVATALSQLAEAMAEG